MSFDCGEFLRALEIILDRLMRYFATDFCHQCNEHCCAVPPAHCGLSTTDCEEVTGTGGQHMSNYGTIPQVEIQTATVANTVIPDTTTTTILTVPISPVYNSPCRQRLKPDICQGTATEPPSDIDIVSLHDFHIL